MDCKPSLVGSTPTAASQEAVIPQGVRLPGIYRPIEVHQLWFINLNLPVIRPGIPGLRFHWRTPMAKKRTKQARDRKPFWHDRLQCWYAWLYVDGKRKMTRLSKDEDEEGLQSDHQRMEAELALRQDRLVSAQEDLQVASARLAQLLHSNPASQIVTGEPAVVPLSLITLDKTPAEFVSMGLSRRPELAEHQHLVCEAVEKLNREKYAPLVPSVLLGVSYGGLGGSIGSSIRNSDDRLDADAVAYWEIRNLGAGERAARDEANSVIRQAQWRQVALLDRIAREVAEAHSQVVQRERRIEATRRGIQSAEGSYALNLQRIENKQGLPIEVLQSIQALATARQAYLNSVVDFNVAQFQLCRAVGWFESGSL